MCLLFLYINNDPGHDGYQLILANNRDEYYSRPTKPASRWENHTSCISGIDLAPQKEGGTWIGVSESGKVASLLNILYKDQSPDKKGRGFLVVDFLKSSSSAQQFTEDIAAERHDYNPFNFVTVENSDEQWKVTYFSTHDKDSPYCMNSDANSKEQIFAFGNSSINIPWKKVCGGKERFSKITRSHSTTADKEQLTSALIDMLSNPTPHLPDPQLQSQAEGYLDDDASQQRSAIYVASPHINYGTRTNTLVLIDADGNGEYIERTMREPIDAHHPVWDTAVVPFSMAH